MDSPVIGLKVWYQPITKIKTKLHACSDEAMFVIGCSFTIDQSPGEFIWDGESPFRRKDGTTCSILLATNIRKYYIGLLYSKYGSCKIKMLDVCGSLGFSIDWTWYSAVVIVHTVHTLHMGEPALIPLKTRKSLHKPNSLLLLAHLTFHSLRIIENCFQTATGPPPRHSSLYNTFPLWGPLYKTTYQSPD